MRPLVIGSFAVGISVFMVVGASAQAVATGTIAGVARDASGGVLPGVTVEAASPALIEKVRTVVTDDQGLYRIVDLRPGVYTVTFGLPGFSTLRREGIELTTGFTATVNAELTVGALEETVTVTGAAPVVDVQNVIQQKQFSRDTLDAVPMGTGTASYAALIPGAVPSVQDVGGTAGVTVQGHTFAIHGGRANDIMIMGDGIQRNIMTGPASSGVSMPVAAAQEVTIQTSGITAEAAVGGVQVNMIPKDGGNRLSGSFEWKYADDNLQNDNVTDALLARGLDPSRRLGLKVNNFLSSGVGGPIKRDRLWFFASHQYWNVEQWVPGVYANATHGTLRYTPDLSRPAVNRNYNNNLMLRLTWQATSKQKITFAPELVPSCTCTHQLDAGNRAPEASS